jgi:hypothetical protein
MKELIGGGIGGMQVREGIRLSRVKHVTSQQGKVWQ